MSAIIIPYVFVPNTLIVSSQVNANFSVIAGIVNGNLDNSNLSAGANISLSKLNNTQTFLDLQAVTNTLGLGVGQTGDSKARVGLFSDGSIQWGPGGSTNTDVGLARSNTNTIQINDGTPATGTGYFDMTYGIFQNAPVGLVPGGRLYMNTGDPYGDHALGATVFYGPATNKGVLINNGTAYILQTFAEVSFSVGSLGSGNYDVYIKSASITTLNTPTTVAWSGSNTPPTRSVDNYGRYCKNGDTTSLLVGTIQVNGSNQTADNTSSRWISNLYNAVPRSLFCADLTSTWATSSTTPVSANGNTTDGTGRVSFVCVLPSFDFQCSWWGDTGNANGGASAGYLGVGVNSTSVYSSYGGIKSTSGDSPVAGSFNGVALAGSNFLQRLNSSVGGAGTNFNGTFSVTGGGAINGLTAMING